MFFFLEVFLVFSKTKVFFFFEKSLFFFFLQVVLVCKGFSFCFCGWVLWFLCMGFVSLLFFNQGVCLFSNLVFFFCNGFWFFCFCNFFKGFCFCANRFVFFLQFRFFFERVSLLVFFLQRCVFQIGFQSGFDKF